MSCIYPTKCDACRICLRCHGDDRRIGSATITIWTRKGLLTLMLCAACVKEGLQTIVAKAWGENNSFFDAINEKDE